MLMYYQSVQLFCNDEFLLVSPLNIFVGNTLCIMKCGYCSKDTCSVRLCPRPFTIVKRTSRKTLNPNDYLVENLVNDTALRYPGSIRGEQFIIQSCTNSVIYLLDHINSVLIDECSYCKIIIGPTKGSVFIRNVNNSVFIIACGQFRASNCYNISVFLLSATVATVEAVSNVYLSCFQLYYKHLEEQFQAAGLSLYNNKWSSAYDFTPSSGEANIKIMTGELDVHDFFPQPADHLLAIDFTFKRISSVVPYTYSMKVLDTSSPCILVFIFPSSRQCETAHLFVRGMHFIESNKLLYTMKSYLDKTNETELLIELSRSCKNLTDGETITLIYNGERVDNWAKQVMLEIGAPHNSFHIFGTSSYAHGLAQRFVATAAFTNS